MMKNFNYPLSVVILLLILSFFQLHAQPTTITYQGVLTDDLGRTLTGTRSIRFDIFSASNGGSSLWNETHGSVEINKGLFQVELGSVNPFGTLDFSQDLWLEITVQGDVMTPRIAFNTVNHSMVAENIASGAAGSIPYQSAEGETSMLAPGIDGQVLALDNGLPTWASINWIGYGDDVYYPSGNVGIGTSDPDNLLVAPLNVEGGIRYAGGSTVANEPGLLYYDNSAPGTFKYYDNDGNSQVLGTGTVSYNGTLWVLSNDDLSPDTRDVVCNSNLAVGIDVETGMDFGDANIYLKENLLRIRFEDTSPSENFPSNDWQLTANSSESIALGGENYFAIEDITNATIPFKVMAETPNNALFISDDGDIGLGTGNPAKKLHLSDGDTPAIRFEQDGSSWPAFTWDVAGNETNFFIRDGTNGGKIPFRIIPNAPYNSIFIAASGNVGFGTANPARKIHVMDAMRLEPTTEPANPAAGDLYFDSDTNKLRCYDGSQWHDLW
jgi:hypothetical protein